MKFDIRRSDDVPPLTTLASVLFWLLSTSFCWNLFEPVSIFRSNFVESVFKAVQFCSKLFESVFIFCSKLDLFDSFKSDSWNDRVELPNASISVCISDRRDLMSDKFLSDKFFSDKFLSDGDWLGGLLLLHVDVSRRSYTMLKLLLLLMVVVLLLLLLRGPTSLL